MQLGILSFTLKVGQSALLPVERVGDQTSNRSNPEKKSSLDLLFAVF